LRRALSGFSRLFSVSDKMKDICFRKTVKLGAVFFAPMLFCLS